MLYAQLAHCVSLNDICDALNNHDKALLNMQNATAPKRNTLSNANKTRDAQFAQDLFWAILNYLQSQCPSFSKDHNYKGKPHRFKRNVFAVDSSVIQLVANCFPWAQHRRRKAAAKCHMKLNLETFLPSYAIIKEANTHDSTEAKEICGTLKPGEVVVFDKAYVDFDHLYHLHQKGVFWVTRMKDNMVYDIIEGQEFEDNIIKKDMRVKLHRDKSKEKFPEVFRIVEADVLVDNKVKRMSFITNNLEWQPSSICELYKSRWAIEVFFKQMKQTLQLGDFFGHSKNAIEWQVWTALLAYVLMRFIAFQNQ